MSEMQEIGLAVTDFMLQVPSCLGPDRFINIKYIFQSITGTKAKGLMSMLTHFGMEFQGRHHSGIDDCRNILAILRELNNRGFNKQVEK